MDRLTAKKILEDVQRTYDAIASDFDASRKDLLWPSLIGFLPCVKQGDKVLDAGCGSGRLLQILEEKKIEYVGIDSSDKLLEKARKRFPGRTFIVGNITSKLPFPDACFDVIFSIAVFHHIPGKEFRDTALSELSRVLKHNGLLVMTNCSWLYTLRYLKYIVYYTFLKLAGRSELDFKDIFVPWAQTGRRRYFHCFTMREIKKLVTKNGFCILRAYNTRKRHAHEKYNLVIMAKKC